MRIARQLGFLAATCLATARAAADDGGALRLVEDPKTITAITEAFAQRDARLEAALDRSLAWLDTPESHAFFPLREPDVDHARARAGVAVFRDLLARSTDDEQFAADLHRLFDVYEAAGVEGDGVMLVTAYYAPVHDASRVAGGRFRHPLYGPPVIDAPRARIETDGLLAGREIAWLADPLAAYFVHVNGSARLRLPDGSTMCVGHVGTNGRPYTSLGRLLIDEGLASASEMSMQTIVDVHRRAPDRVEALMRRNERFVFFEERGRDEWPVSDLGIVLTPEASVATDRALFPAGGVVLVDTAVADGDGGERPFRRFMLDQDRGGAIKGPGRVDLFLGVGAAAGEVAGRQRHPGRLYCLVLKAEATALPCGR